MSSGKYLGGALAGGLLAGLGITVMTIAGAKTSGKPSELIDLQRASAHKFDLDAVAHWLTGPALGVKAPEWTSDRKTLGMHALDHVGFGLTTAFAARTAAWMQ